VLVFEHCRLLQQLILFLRWFALIGEGNIEVVCFKPGEAIGSESLHPPTDIINVRFAKFYCKVVVSLSPTLFVAPQSILPLRGLREGILCDGHALCHFEKQSDVFLQSVW